MCSYVHGARLVDMYAPLVIINILEYINIYMSRIAESVVVLKILGNVHRFAILRLLLAANGKEYCVNEIAEKVGISQSLTSQNLAYLVARGALEGHRVGQTTCYALANTSVVKMIARVMVALA
jgi:predicted transcriptional regulator